MAERFKRVNKAVQCQPRMQDEQQQFQPRMQHQTQQARPEQTNRRLQCGGGPTADSSVDCRHSGEAPLGVSLTRDVATGVDEASEGSWAVSVESDAQTEPVEMTDQASQTESMGSLQVTPEGSFIVTTPEVTVLVRGPLRQV